MTSKITLIPIEQLLKFNPELAHYKNSVILANNSEIPLEPIYQLFRYPFKLDALVIMIILEDYIDGYINLRNFQGRKNQLLICSPQNILQMKSPQFSSSKIMVISIDFILGLKLGIENLQTALNRINQTPVLNLTEENIEELSALFTLIEKNITRENSNQEKLLEKLIAAYLIELANILTSQTPISPNKNPQRDSIWLSKFIDLLDKYHQQERSVEFYAEKLFITPKYLSTVIKRTSGYNATNWINRYVILEAQSLLKYSDKSIQEIADCLNFSNASFFGKYFKRHTGMTPGEYKAAL